MKEIQNGPNWQTLYMCSEIVYLEALLDTLKKSHVYPDSQIHGANMGPTWVLSAPDGPHVGPMNPAIRVFIVWNMTMPHLVE